MGVGQAKENTDIVLMAASAMIALWTALIRPK